MYNGGKSNLLGNGKLHILYKLQRQMSDETQFSRPSTYVNSFVLEHLGMPALVPCRKVNTTTTAAMLDVFEALGEVGHKRHSEEEEEGSPSATTTKLSIW